MKVNEQDAVTQRARTLFEESQNDVHRRTDQLFAKLLIVQWLAGIAAALWISPKTWIGTTSQTHWHVWAALFLGSAITSLPVFLAWKHPGRILTRHSIAIAQTLTSALLIHLTGGRIETHFHVFGSLAFLAFYRDWKVLLSATIVVTLDHMVRGFFWSQSVFGVLAVSQWRWLEHAGWVIFEDTFLFISIRQGMRDMSEVASRRARLEAVNAELTSAHRSVEASEQRLKLILDTHPECVKQVAADGTLLEMNPAGLRLVEVADSAEVLGRCAYDLVAPEHLAMFTALNDAVFRGESKTEEFELIGLKGTRRWMQTHACPLRDMDGQIIAQLAVSRDISERKRSEAELDKAHKELVYLSRQAGMAEVATSVLHNVGNVLNSVNTSIGVATEKAGQMNAASLSRLAVLLREHSEDLPAFFANHPQGARVPQFLEQLAGHFAADQKTVLHEIDSLRTNIEHINEIVAMQQSYATAGGVIETLPLAEVVEDALRMNSAAFDRHGTRVIRDFDSKLPLVAVDRNKVLLILVNLVRNAKYACDDAGHADKRITVRTHLNGDGIAKISVSDNGIGIPRENLTRIFEHGFTTRKGGHGFGLHSSALAASEMGGALRAHSDGLGHGATFTIELPVKPTNS